jgi:hypothetical protein
VQNQTKTGILLLIPPFLVWTLVLLVLFEDPTGLYVIENVSPNILDIGFFVGGLIFPLTSTAVGANGLWNKQDKAFNIGIIVVSILFLFSTLIITLGILS